MTYSGGSLVRGIHLHERESLVAPGLADPRGSGCHGLASHCGAPQPLGIGIDGETVLVSFQIRGPDR